MAPPIISGFSPLLTKANFASSVIATNVPVAPVLSVDGERLRADTNTGAESPFSWVEIPVEGGPLDLSSAIVECLVEQNWGTGRDFSIGFSSGVTPDENWQVWRCPGGLINRRVQYFLDPSSSDFYRSAGTFDPSDVQRFRYQWNGNQSDRNVFFTDEPIWIPKNPGLVAVGGDALTPITAGTFGNFLALPTSEGGYHTETIEVTSQQGFSDYQALPVSCSIGDGGSAQVTRFDSAVLKTPDPTDVSSGTVEPTVAISSTNRIINTSSSESFSALQVIGLSAADAFQDISPISNVYTNFFARSLGVIDLGQGDYQGRISQAFGVVQGGRNLALNFGGSTAQYTYTWNGAANLSGSVFDSPGSDYAINFDGTEFADGATFDATNLSFETEPVVNRFRIDAAGKTLNLNVGSSGLSASDIDIIAGSPNVIANQLTLTLTDLPIGAEVRIYDLDNTLPDFGTELTGEESITSTSFSWAHSKAGDDVFVQVFATGFKEYGETISLLSVSQNLAINLDAEDSF